MFLSNVVCCALLMLIMCPYSLLSKMQRYMLARESFCVYSAQVAVQSIVINPSVCLCLSVCLRAYLWNRWTDIHKVLCEDPLRPWLVSALVAL